MAPASTDRFPEAIEEEVELLGPRLRESCPGVVRPGAGPAGFPPGAGSASVLPVPAESAPGVDLSPRPTQLGARVAAAQRASRTADGGLPASSAAAVTRPAGAFAGHGDRARYESRPPPTSGSGVGRPGAPSPTADAREAGSPSHAGGSTTAGSAGLAGRFVHTAAAARSATIRLHCHTLSPPPPRPTSQLARAAAGQRCRMSRSVPMPYAWNGIGITPRPRVLGRGIRGAPVATRAVASGFTRCRGAGVNAAERFSDVG